MKLCYVGGFAASHLNSSGGGGGGYFVWGLLADVRIWNWRTREGEGSSHWHSFKIILSLAQAYREGCAGVDLLKI